MFSVSEVKKELIGAEAAKLVQDGDGIALDVSVRQSTN